MLKNLTKICSSRKIQKFFFVLLFLVLIFSIYITIPYPYILGADAPQHLNKVSINAPITMHFSQSMNKQSVEDKFQIHPQINGDFVWPNKKTLEFYPSETFKIGDRYKITISSQAKNIYRKSLGSNIAMHFFITGPPYVKFVSPNFPIERQLISYGGSMERQSTAPQEPIKSPSIESVPIISSDQVITVMFDRPMGWSDNTKIDLLRINPHVEGEYRFLGMSAFQFIPESWPTGTRFKLTVPSNIQARDGGETEDEFSWYIETSPLRIVKTTPEIGEENVGTNTPLTIVFNQPIDLNQIQPGNNSLIYPSNDVDADVNPKSDGFFNTEIIYGKNSQGITDKAILVFEPTFSYLYDTEYKFVMKAGLSGNSTDAIDGVGSLGMKQDYELTFKTTQAPGVIDFTGPSDKNPNIFISFSTDMTVKEIMEHLMISPEPLSPITIIMSENNREAEIHCKFAVNTDYELELNAPLKDIAGNEIKNSFKKAFRVKDPYQKLQWDTGDNLDLFAREVNPEFIIKSKNINELNLELCKVSERNFMTTNENQNWENYSCYSNPISYKIHPDSGSALLNLSSIFNREFQPGIYYFSAKSSNSSKVGDSKKIYKIFLVSDTALILKKSQNSLLLWATDIVTGEPAARMELTFYSYDGKEIGRGVTDGDGIYKIIRDYEEGVYIVGEQNIGEKKRWTMIYDFWLTSEQNISSSINSEWIKNGELRAYLMYNKNVLTAGDKMDIKGILRVDNDAQFSIPEEKKVIIAIEDSQQNLLIDETIAIRRNGSFDTSITIPPDAFSGNYRIVVYSASGDKLQTNESVITINREDSPFLMNWINPKNDYFAHETVSVTLKANYFVGIPASSLRGSWDLYRKPYYFNNYKNNSFYSFGNKENILCSNGGCPNDEEFVASGEFSFDPNGIAQIVLADNERSYLKSENEYYLVATASSVNGSKVSKSLRFIVHNGKQYVGLSSKHYLLKQNESAEISIVVSDTKGNLIEDKKVNLSLIQMSDGNEGKSRYSDNIIVTSEPVNLSIPITNKIPEGIYKLKAKSQDDFGNYTISELELYVINGNGNAIFNDLKILMDQPEYYVGGKTRMLINYPDASSEKPTTALVTYERVGVLGYRIVELTSPLTEVDIPIIKEMIPNMHISVTLIEQNSDKLDDLLQAQEKRRLEIKSRQTEVEIILLEEELALLQADENSNEDDVELLLQKIELFNESTIEISDDENDGDIKFMPTIKRDDINVIISNPDQIINIDILPEPSNPRPGEEVTIKLHTYDYQNRQIPSVVSLNISEKQMGSDSNTNLTLFDYFLKLRDSQVFMSSNISLLDDQLSRQQSVLPSYSLNQMSEISNSSYFNPLILTDDSGYGEITFTLPDKHMAWQINALATSKENNFGNSSMNLFAKKRLVITPILPAFVIPGDQITITAKVQNLSDSDIKTAIELLAGEIDVKGGTKKNLTIKSGETINIDWDVIIGFFNEETNFKIAFRSREDYVETNLPIKKLKTYVIFGNSGIISAKGGSTSGEEDERVESIRIPQNAVSDVGDLSLSLSASPISIAKNYAKSLGDYSFNSTEKIASRLISDIIFLRPEKSDMTTKTLSDEIQSTVLELQNLQRQDGGYAFFKGADESNPWLTAYVTYALGLADGLFDVSANSKEAGIKYLWGKLNNESLSDQFFILWALSELEEYDTVTTLDLYKKRNVSSLSGKAFLLMNIQNLVEAGQKSAQPFLEKLKSEIVEEKITDDNWIYFEEEKGENLDTDIRSTAIVLMSLAKLSDENPILMPIIEYLASNTTTLINNFNSQEVIWLLLALTEMTNQHELNVNFTTKAKVNNKTVIDESIQTENIQDIYSAILPISELKGTDQVNELRISKEGSGDLFFSTSLSYSLQNDKILPIEENAVITRNYYTLEDFNEETPLSELMSGILYKGVLTLVIPEDTTYIAIENPLPAGLKALSFNPAVSNISMRYERDESARANGLTWIDNPLWLFDYYSIEDDRMFLYSENLPVGIYKIDYLVQAGMHGKYNHLPATVKQMFNSDMYSRTGGGWMRIK